MTKFITAIITTSIAVLFLACTPNSSNNTNGNSDTKNKVQGCAAESVLPDNTQGGCRIRLVSPSQCEEIDLSNGRTYEFAWTTDGTTCETPWSVIVAGNPATEQNALEYKINTNGAEITTKGAVINVDFSAFSGLESSDGTYHWVVKGYYGSHPASIKFKIKK